MKILDLGQKKSSKMEYMLDSSGYNSGILAW
jgi:hypothetical protein